MKSQQQKQQVKRKSRPFSAPQRSQSEKRGSKSQEKSELNLPLQIDQNLNFVKGKMQNILKEGNKKDVKNNQIQDLNNSVQVKRPPRFKTPSKGKKQINKLVNPNDKLNSTIAIFNKSAKSQEGSGKKKKQKAQKLQEEGRSFSKTPKNIMSSQNSNKNSDSLNQISKSSSDCNQSNNSAKDQEEQKDKQNLNQLACNIKSK